MHIVYKDVIFKFKNDKSMVLKLYRLDGAETINFLREYSCKTCTTVRVEEESVNEFASFTAHSTNSKGTGIILE